MIGKEDALKVLEKVVSFSKNFEVSAFLSAEDLSLTRYYENHIHQNLRRHNQTLTVRVVRGKRSGVFQPISLMTALCGGRCSLPTRIWKLRVRTRIS